MRYLAIVLMTVCLAMGLANVAYADKATSITVSPGDDVQNAVDNYDIVYFNPGTYDFGNNQLLITNSTALIGISGPGGEKPLITGNGNLHDDDVPDGYPTWYGSVLGFSAPGHSFELKNLKIAVSGGHHNSSALFYGGGKTFAISDCVIEALDAFAGIYIGLAVPGNLIGDVLIKDSTIHHYAITPIPDPGYFLGSLDDPLIVLLPTDSYISLGIFISPYSGPFDSIKLSRLSVTGPNNVGGDFSDTIGLYIRGGSDAHTTTVITDNTVISNGYALIVNPSHGTLKVSKNELECTGYFMGSWATGMLLSGPSDGIISHNTIKMNSPPDQGIQTVGVQLGAPEVATGCRNKLLNQNKITGVVDWMAFAHAYFDPNVIVTGNVFKNFDRSELTISDRAPYGVPACEYGFSAVYWDPALINNFDNVVIDNALSGSLEIDGSSYPAIIDLTDNPATPNYDGANIIRGRLHHIYIQPPGWPM